MSSGEAFSLKDRTAVAQKSPIKVGNIAMVEY